MKDAALRTLIYLCAFCSGVILGVGRAIGETMAIINIGFKNAHDGLSLEIRQVLLFAQPVIGDAAKGLCCLRRA